VTFVVAEIGVNWDGNLNLAEEMMSNAKQAGCNAVKFQSFTKELVQNHPETNRLLKTSISEDNIQFIDDIAKKIGIEWFCTPMYAEAVSLLNPYVKRFKIREFDARCTFEGKNSELLDKAFKTGKNIIISSNKSPKFSSIADNSNVDWLYVVPKYPCEISDLDFVNINEFSGYSNHSILKIVPLTAAVLGSKIIEIHITSDKKGNFVDNNVSFDYDELFDLLKNIRLIEKIKK
jgi:sialic acid synthase SpsE